MSTIRACDHCKSSALEFVTVCDCDLCLDCAKLFDKLVKEWCFPSSQAKDIALAFVTNEQDRM